MHQFFRQIDGAEVGVGVVASAQGQEGAAFGLFVDGDFLGFFEAESDGAFEDGIGVVADGFGFVGEGGAVIEPGFSSEGCVSEVEFRVGCLFDFFEDVDGLGGDFWTDSVAFEYCNDFCVGHRILVLARVVWVVLKWI